ncbi:MAG: hypothetical protein HS117_04440 [Verrucomicrobiaceae bacterium]|jgi:signal transduction histidine kinase|nr:hypothetical protein [Verrucomicrobiaceae bacterium]
MKAPRSIQRRISVVVLLFGTVTILLNNWRNQRWLVERRLERLEQEAADTGSRLSGVLQHLSRRQQDRAAELEMAYASLSPDVELGVVCDKSGLIRHATQLQWRGVHVEDSPLAEEWNEAVAVMERMATSLKWKDSKGKLLVIAPFFESYDVTDKAVVMIRYDPAASFSQVREEAWLESLRHGAVLLALTLLLWYAMDEMVVRRVKALLGQVSAVGTSGRGVEPLKGKDELSVISREFAGAVERLGEAERLLLEAAEEERRRIGRDLHDDLCQRLSATKMKMEVMLGLEEGRQPEAASLADQVVKELKEAVEIARGLARGLSPVGLDAHGVRDALEELARFTRDAFQTSCFAEGDDVDDALDARARELFFRVAQELVMNACKHSRPSVMSITTRLEDDHIVLSVLHDGEPFREPVAAGPTGMGLHLMTQRLRALDATLERTLETDVSIITVRVPRQKKPRV